MTLKTTLSQRSKVEVLSNKTWFADEVAIPLLHFSPLTPHFSDIDWTLTMTSGLGQGLIEHGIL